jgi:hypothetical protein
VKTALATIIAMGALAGSVPAFGQPATLVARHDAYCLQGGLWGFPGTCQFATFQECKVTGSGITGVCVRNPRAYNRPEPWRS